MKMLEKAKQLLDNGYKIGLFFMEIPKAFGILHYFLLLAKLNPHGFSLISTIFIQSMLNKRMQKVNVSNKFSAWKDIYSGVPQGLIPEFSSWKHIYSGVSQGLILELSAWKDIYSCVPQGLILEFSAWKDICSGVSKGLIFGRPLLFSIFINDILSFLTTCDMCNYADDNTL